MGLGDSDEAFGSIAGRYGPVDAIRDARKVINQLRNLSEIREQAIREHAEVGRQVVEVFAAEGIWAKYLTPSGHRLTSRVSIEIDERSDDEDLKDRAGLALADVRRNMRYFPMLRYLRDDEA